MSFDGVETAELLLMSAKMSSRIIQFYCKKYLPNIGCHLVALVKVVHNFEMHYNKIINAETTGWSYPSNIASNTIGVQVVFWVVLQSMILGKTRPTLYISNSEWMDSHNLACKVSHVRNNFSEG